MYSLIEIALTLGVFVTLVLSISACVCGCKNSNQKSELVGTAGVLKIHYDEEAPSPTPTTPASIKRASAQNSQRSLPEIPQPVGRHDSGDTASEIYATVNIDEGHKNKALPSSSRDHPYEHAYAKLQNDNQVNTEASPEQELHVELQAEERDMGDLGPESVVISASVAISGQLPSSQELPYITPPSPRALDRSQQHFSGDSTDSAKGYTSITVREPLSNIRATLQPNRVQPQAQYVTVSDDSDEMYAAIEEPASSRGAGDVEEARGRPSAAYAPAPPAAAPARRSLEREPAGPRAGAAADIATRRSAPPEMGATNATHSRQASSSSCTNSAAHGSPKPEKRQANSPLPPTPASARPAAPAPANAPTHAPTHAPSHAPTHAPTHAHRQQRISSTGDLHFNHDKVHRSFNEKHQRNNSCVSSSDFYGCNYPVDKHRFSSGDLCRPLGGKELRVAAEPAPDAVYDSIEGSAGAAGPARDLDDMYAKVLKKSKHKPLPDDGLHVTRRNKDPPRGDAEPYTSKYRDDDPGYETIDRKKPSGHGYETIAPKDRQSARGRDPGYETVKDVHRNVPNANFSNNNLLKSNVGADSGPDSMPNSDPGYERIARTDNSASDSDPNYEVLRNQPPTPPYATIAPPFEPQPTYSVVNKKLGPFGDWTTNNNDPTLEPNYESMPNDPSYTTGSESDPNYESVRPKDPNYESVSGHDPNYESLHRKDPKYESLRSKDSNYDSVRLKDPNYESVKYFELSKREPPYEKLLNKSSESDELERSDSTAGYEKINIANSRDPKSSINNPENGTVSDYFQV